MGLHLLDQQQTILGFLGRHCCALCPCTQLSPSHEPRGSSLRAPDWFPPPSSALGSRCPVLHGQSPSY